MIFRLPQRILGPALFSVGLLVSMFSFAERAAAGTLEDVKARGKLICGVSEGLSGFSEKDASGAWAGFDVDFCKAVALAVLGDSTKIDYVPLSATDRFNALTDKHIDLLSRNSTWTLTRDASLGLEFVGVSYFDGQGFMVPALYGASSPLELGGATICVVSGTTTQDNATAYFEKAGLKVSFLTFPERKDARQAYADGKCDAYTADRSALAAERSLLPTPDDQTILKDVISKEPLGPVVRDDDPKWVNVVRWVLFGLIDGEEIGLSSTSIGVDTSADAARLGALSGPALGLDDDWLVKVIGGVGNYGEIFARNIGEDTTMQLGRGINALWTQGGILYAPPIQ
jgi:general L-amino acid transport system substrate-binding protein